LGCPDATGAAARPLAQEETLAPEGGGAGVLLGVSEDTAANSTAVVDELQPVPLLARSQSAGEPPHPHSLAQHNMPLQRSESMGLDAASPNVRVSEPLASFASFEGLDLDSSFTGYLREARSHITRDRGTLQQYATITKNMLTQQFSADKIKRLNSKLLSVIKALVTIAGGLAIAKEVRDLFEDLIEKVAKPLKEVDMSTQDCALIFEALTHTFGKLDDLQGVMHIGSSWRDPVVHSWTRYLTVVKACTILCVPVVA
jgi:hypothetical protein